MGIWRAKKRTLNEGVVMCRASGQGMRWNGLHVEYIKVHASKQGSRCRLGAGYGYMEPSSSTRQRKGVAPLRPSVFILRCNFPSADCIFDFFLYDHVCFRVFFATRTNFRCNDVGSDFVPFSNTHKGYSFSDFHYKN